MYHCFKISIFYANIYYNRIGAGVYFYYACISLFIFSVMFCTFQGHSFNILLISTYIPNNFYDYSIFLTSPLNIDDSLITFCSIYFHIVSGEEFPTNRLL
jgi:hypothetical protein